MKSGPTRKRLEELDLPTADDFVLVDVPLERPEAAALDLHWQNTYLGDPLTTPYAERPTVTVAETRLAGDERLVVTASHPDGIARIRVYVDGLRRADVVSTAAGPSFTHQVSLQGLAPGPHEVLAVAFARNALVERSSWPEPLQLPKADSRARRARPWRSMRARACAPRVRPPSRRPAVSPEGAEASGTRFGREVPPGNRGAGGYYNDNVVEHAGCSAAFVAGVGGGGATRRES